MLVLWGSLKQDVIQQRQSTTKLDGNAIHTAIQYITPPMLRNINHSTSHHTFFFSLENGVYTNVINVRCYAAFMRATHFLTKLFIVSFPNAKSFKNPSEARAFGAACTCVSQINWQLHHLPTYQLFLLPRSLEAIPKMSVIIKSSFIILVRKIQIYYATPNLRLFAKGWKSLTLVVGWIFRVLALLANFIYISDLIKLLIYITGK
jgi:hypothetical protein